MATANRCLGVVGIGNMGQNIIESLRAKGYSLVIYDRKQDKYPKYDADKNIYCAKSIEDFAERLRLHGTNAIVWLMLPGGAVTNDFVSRLSNVLHEGDIVIDGSNSMYEDSIANSLKLSGKGINYLDVGCGGGPKDLLTGISLMVGGEKAAFEKAEHIFRAVAGKGTYGYVGKSGSGHMVKMVHNIVFYSIFPVFAEGTEMLLKMGDDKNSGFNAGEALRLLAASPPINTEITSAIAEAYAKGLPDDAPEMAISEMVKMGVEKAHGKQIDASIIEAVLSRYPSMSGKSRAIYAAAKNAITGH